MTDQPTKRIKSNRLQFLNHWTNQIRNLSNYTSKVTPFDRNPLLPTKSQFQYILPIQSLSYNFSQILSIHAVNGTANLTPYSWYMLILASTILFFFAIHLLTNKRCLHISYIVQLRFSYMSTLTQNHSKKQKLPQIGQDSFISDTMG